jgi:hypothetical protein
VTIKLSEARQLCTKPELELVVSASPKELSGITPARLDKKIERARKLRDKYAELAVAQQRKTQTIKGSRAVGDANARTKRKAEIFGELIEKLGARKTLLEERKRKALEAAAKMAAKAAAKKATKQAPKKAAKKGDTAKKLGEKATSKALAKKPALKKAVSKASPRKKAVTPGGQSGAKPNDAKIEQRTRSTAINAHISSQGKRDQARRDSKGR